MRLKCKVQPVEYKLNSVECEVGVGKFGVHSVKF